MKGFLSQEEPSPARGNRTLRPTRVLLRGLSLLIQGQRAFADEFGLAYERVFGDGFEAFKGRDPAAVLAEWLREGDRGARRIERVLQDLIQHQLALIGAFDGIAMETLGAVGEDSSGRTLFSPLVRSRRRARLQRELTRNPNLRHARLVLPGCVRGYVRTREKSSDQK